MTALIVGHVLAVGIGLSLGLIGGGGSVLAVPILVYVMGVGSREAIAMSLFIVGCVSLLGAFPAAKCGNFSGRIVAAFTPAAMLGAYLGSQLVKLPWITDTLQLVSFGLVMLAASILMIQKGPSRQDRSASQGAILSRRPASNSPKQASVRTGSKQAWDDSPLWKNFAIPIEGLGVGIVTGFVGGGGGFLIIPALVLLSHIPIKKAVGTSLLIISLNSAVGFVGYLNQVSIDWSLTLSFTLAAAIGIFLGSSLSKKIAASRLQKGFGYFVLIVATFVLIKR